MTVTRDWRYAQVVARPSSATAARSCRSRLPAGRSSSQSPRRRARSEPDRLPGMQPLVRRRPAARRRCLMTRAAFIRALDAHLRDQEVSQAALARRIGISAQAVSAWFVAGVTPDRQRIIEVEDALGLTRGTLLVPAGYVVPGHPDPTTTVESLILADETLSADGKRSVLRVLQIEREHHARREQKQ